MTGNESDNVTANNTASETTTIYDVPSISGRVKDASGNSLSGVTITLSGAKSATTQTSSTGFYQFTELQPGGNYVLTPTRDNFRFDPANAAINNLSGEQTVNFVATPITLQFTSANYVVDESANSILITVRRTGDLSGATTVDYATEDGSASARTDYTVASGTLRFGPGESLKSFILLITDDALVEGTEALTVSLSNPNGAIFEGQSEHGPIKAQVEIRDNDTSQPTYNPIDDAQFFVRQHYYDFLNRLPDEGGLGYWTSQITNCGTDPNCINSRRIGVSAAFFIELEFQDTGSFVYRFYKASYGVRPSYDQFMPDRAKVVAGVDLESGKQAFADQWVQRPEFLAKYPASLSGTQFIDSLLQTVQQGSGVDLSPQRSALINDFNANQSRARILRLVVDDARLQTAEYNRAFVLMQYFGYLRRDPDEGGYLFWLDVLNNRVANNYRGMVCAFLTSAEHQARFSTVRTRNDSICKDVGP